MAIIKHYTLLDKTRNAIKSYIIRSYLRPIFHFTDEEFKFSPNIASWEVKKAGFDDQSYTAYETC